MSIAWLDVLFEGMASETTGTALFEQLGLEPDAGFEARHSWPGHHPATIVFLEVRLDPLKEPHASHTEFWARVEEGFKRAADWLLSRPVAPFEAWRAAGRELRVFICWKIDDEDPELDLTLPAEFLSACGRVGVPIELYTNE